MKIKTILLLLFTCILPDCLYAEVILPPDTLGPDKLYRDSTYRRVIKEGTAGLNCYFSYPQGGMADTERLRRQCRRTGEAG